MSLDVNKVPYQFEPEGHKGVLIEYWVYRATVTAIRVFLDQYGALHDLTPAIRNQSPRSFKELLNLTQEHHDALLEGDHE